MGDSLYLVVVVDSLLDEKMEILYYILAALMSLFGLTVLIAASKYQFQHLGLTLGGLAYLSGGLLTGYLLTWWPLISGFILAIIFKKLFGDPSETVKNEYFELSKSIVKDPAKLGELLMDEIKNDPICKQLFNKHYVQLAENGFLLKFSQDNLNEEPFTTNLVPWFLDRLRRDLSEQADSTKEDFLELINNLKKKDAQYLELVYQIVDKYNLKTYDLKEIYSQHLSKFSTDDRMSIEYGLFADLLLTGELRILEYVYQKWY
ncbi:MAG: hypothetical protein RLO17_23030 [Cyclobacteriaceae bacterium]